MNSNAMEALQRWHRRVKNAYYDDDYHINSDVIPLGFQSLVDQFKSCSMTLAMDDKKSEMPISRMRMPELFKGRRLRSHSEPPKPQSDRDTDIPFQLSHIRMVSLKVGL